MKVEVEIEDLERLRAELDRKTRALKSISELLPDATKQCFIVTQCKIIADNELL